MYRRQWIPMALICASLFAAYHAPVEAEDHNAAEEVSRDFSSVAKRAIPSVVSIQVKAATPPRGAPHSFEQDDPFAPFNDDFFSYFFRAPRRRAVPHQEPHAVSQASGFIVSKDGYVLTNNHVVEGGGQLTVMLNDGREFHAAVIGQDPNTDLAVIKIDGDNFPYLPLGNSETLQVGQWVVAIGTPLGLQASLTVGVVSAKGRSNLDIAHIEDFIQTDAAINRGNSGGPLLNLEGEVVGINTAIVSNMGGYMGIGFAIPSNIAQHVMDALIKEGSISRGFLGITLQAVNQDLAQAFDLKKVEGALVTEVVAGSPAERGGLKQGDIILSYNDHPIPTISTLRNAISLMKPGTAITLQVLRDGTTHSVTVDVSLHPDSQVTDSSGDNRFGIEVESITTEIAKNLGLIDDSGVIVSRVKANSPAAWVGIKRGALIIEINKQKVASAQEFYQYLRSAAPNKPIVLLIKQDEMTRYVSLKVG